MCDNDKLEYDSRIEYGQGDCTFECFIICKKCGLSFKTLGGWGTPPVDAETKSWRKWNRRLQ
jgi:hypothetical protein